jgi:hypothetical protein
MGRVKGMRLLDTASKILLANASCDFLHWLAPELRIMSARIAATEAITSKRLADKVLEFELQRAGDSVEKLTLHVEVQSRWRSNLPWRMLRYHVGLKDQHEELSGLLIVLKDGGSMPSPRYVKSNRLGLQTSHEFRIRCLWHDSTQELRDTNLPALIALVPFAHDADDQAIKEALGLLRKIPKKLARDELRSCLLVFASTVFDSIDWYHYFEQEELMASSLISQFRTHFKAEGRVTILRRQLEARLGDLPATLTSDLQKLSSAAQDELAEALVTIRSKKELLKKLKSLLSGEEPSKN